MDFQTDGQGFETLTGRRNSFVTEEEAEKEKTMNQQM